MHRGEPYDCSVTNTAVTFTGGPRAALWLGKNAIAKSMPHVRGISPWSCGLAETLPPGRFRTVTLVEDTANVAARLCSRARDGEVLFSSTVAAALDAGTDLGPIVGSSAFLLSPQFALRGRNGLIDIWCVPPAVANFTKIAGA